MLYNTAPHFKEKDPLTPKRKNRKGTGSHSKI
jgi:hypothetical protein